MIAKLIVKANDREEALQQIAKAIDETSIDGIKTNLRYLGAIVKSEVFKKGEQTTKYLNDFEFTANSIDVLRPGTQTTIQDFPGRTGFWDIGVPPSGPFDNFFFVMLTVSSAMIKKLQVWRSPLQDRHCVLMLIRLLLCAVHRSMPF